MSELTATQRAIRIIVAQHLPGVPTDRATSYADRIHVNTPLSHIGLTDGAYVAATLAIEAAYGFDLPDELWEGAKTVADIAALVDRYASAEAAA
ncbi:hypothetical protein J2X45_003899 [Caulobacter sp. BE264]|uniref:acyl carrier protein n=1 Tax=Caulobacter sp. BE264 TaxID=2817724 RepID=UPI0028677D48|nr:acyl carrier protein [Caulobacter sp. BE264]MDR7232789.1 hypothetical protein [Caulobacter sp. BE264]